MVAHWNGFEALETEDLHLEPTALSYVAFYVILYGLFQLACFTDWFFRVMT